MAEQDPEMSGSGEPTFEQTGADNPATAEERTPPPVASTVMGNMALGMAAVAHPSRLPGIIRGALGRL
jgi:hypothetical protein